VQSLDRKRRVTALPFQQAGVPEAAGLTYAECEQAAWAVADDRRRYRGAAAVTIALSVALGTNLPIWLYSLPLLRPVQDRIYDWVVRNRSLLPGDTPFCEQHPGQCGTPDSTSV